MSDSPLMSKMDALLKKHRGGGGEPPSVPAHIEHASPAAHTPPPNAWLPVLTQVIERGTPPPVVRETVHPTAAETMPAPSMIEPPAPVARASTPDSQPSEPDVPALANEPDSAVSDTLAEQLMSELAPRLSEVMEKQVAAELRKNLDQTVANLLSQLDVNVREIVRDAVTEKLKQPRDPSS
jgi:hypothetical protein